MMYLEGGSMYKLKKIGEKFKFSKYTDKNEWMYAAEGTADQILLVMENDNIKDPLYAIEMLKRHPTNKYRFDDKGEIIVSDSCASLHSKTTH